MFLLALTSVEWSSALWTIAIGVVCNLSCALLGCFLVLRRMSMMGDAIGHGVVPGIALAVFFTGQITSVYILVGAMVFGLLTAVLAQTLNSYAGVTEDASLGISFTSLFAVGVILISRLFPHMDLDPSCVFNGLLQTVVLDTSPWFGVEIPRAFPTMLLALIMTLAFLSLCWKELKITSLDPALATAMGFNTRLMHYLLIALVAGVVVAAFEAVGSILVIAMLIVPAATAHLLADRLFLVLIWSGVLAVTSAVLGYVLASQWVWDANVGGMMAAVAGGQLFLAVLFAPRHGVIARAARTLRLAVRIAAEDVLAILYRQQESGKLAPALAEPGTSPFMARLALLSLQRQGLIQRDNGRWQLTQSGKQPAASIVRAHRLWESFLGEHFELPLDHLHAAAERMEHYIGPELQSELAQVLEQPAVDPHGKAIPPLKDAQP